LKKKGRETPTKENLQKKGKQKNNKIRRVGSDDVRVEGEEKNRPEEKFTDHPWSTPKRGLPSRPTTTTIRKQHWQP